MTESLPVETESVMTAQDIVIELYTTEMFVGAFIKVGTSSHYTEVAVEGEPYPTPFLGVTL